MTFERLLLRNLFYHWRGNLAVLLGVAVGTAVLVGALLVGDSLRGSLRALTLEKLGWVEQALVGGRFVRQQLAEELQKDGAARRVCPVLLLQGTIGTAAQPTPGERGERPVRSASHINILGVPGTFWQPEGELGPPLPHPEAVFLNTTLAHELNVKAGDRITLHLQKVTGAPHETLMGQRKAEDVLESITLPVGEVLPDDRRGANFNLRPGLATARNAFVRLPLLQEKLGLEGRVNALLVAGARPDLPEKLHQRLTLDDWGLVLRTPQSRTEDLFDKLDGDHDGKLEPNEWRGWLPTHFVTAADRNGDKVLTRDEVAAFYRRQRAYLSLESRNLFVEPAVADAALAAAPESHLTAAPTLVYVANSIADRDLQISCGTVAALWPVPSPLGLLAPGIGYLNQEVPYSIVAALDPDAPPPLGPFVAANGAHLRDDQVLLADWRESPVRARPGDPITLRYFVPAEQDQLREAETTLPLAGLVPMEGAAANADLTPEFPGITDKPDKSKLEPPFPYEAARIQRRDDRYWEEYRTTPTAYVTLATGQKLWRSRFGDLTSIRLAPEPGAPGTPPPDLDKVAKDFQGKLLAHLQPEQVGLVFDNVRQRGLDASAGFTNFGLLYLAFSCFLIAAALLLVGLLFRLNLDRRANEVGILLSTGYRRGTVRWLLLGEGALLAVVGGLLGLAGGVLYAWLLLGLLRSPGWLGQEQHSFLRLHVTALSFVIGYGAALLVSLLTVLWAVFALGRVSPRALLGGVTVADGAGLGRRARWSLLVAAVAVLGAVACMVGGQWVRDEDMKAFTFFSSGALLLIASLAGLWAWLRRPRPGMVSGHGGVALARLGARNAARHPVRSLLTAGLLASATFLVVAVESFHRDPGQDFYDRKAGSGGFTLLAESDLPIYQDLGSGEGREELGFTEKGASALEGVPVFSFRLHAGEDASCLNLYRPLRPRLLGVPRALIERGGFRFDDMQWGPGSHSDNPWTLLDEKLPNDVIPVFGESNTVQWMLRSGLGQDMQVPDERGRTVTLRFVGLLKDSVFQSELLLSEQNFLRLYPHQEGYQFFLVGAPPDRMEPVKDALQANLSDQGLAVASTKQKLAAYLAVENTYLSTFQALGGLGLLLGALGLAVVLLRSVWERRGELALLRALGFRQWALGWLVLSENGYLLALGLLAGTVTALLAVAPHLAAGSGAVPWGRLVVLLGLVLVVGLTSALIAVTVTLQAPLLPALRRE